MELLNQIELEESLQKATPYMLRNDGILLKNDLMHPYIIYNKEVDPQESLRILFTKNRWMIEWFYNNTRYEDTRKLIEELIKSLLIANVEYIDIDWVEEKFNISEKTNYSTKEVDYVELLEDINNRVNQEFLRIRTSNLKYGGDNGDLYCRISSNNFNWYPLISELIIKNMSFVETITITNDPQAFGNKLKTYKVKGQLIDHLPAKEFITLKGNPIIEKYQWGSILNDATKSFSKGNSLEEVFYGIHPRYVNIYYNKLSSDWIKNNYE